MKKKSGISVYYKPCTADNLKSSITYETAAIFPATLTATVE
jgi:hypothetical protein